MTNSEFRFSKNIAHARTIPAEWCTNPARLQLEQEKIFKQSWQSV